MRGRRRARWFGALERACTVVMWCVVVWTMGWGFFRVIEWGIALWAIKAG